MSIIESKQALDRVIEKARVHLYKPIQVAEILYRDRVVRDIDLAELESYRTASKRWRDLVCITFLGRTSTSSARYQDDLFNGNATPPEVLVELGEENRVKGGVVEAYIYSKFAARFGQMSTALNYCRSHGRESFDLADFLSMFWQEPGLRRSIDKVYEIVVYALFSALVDALEITVEVSMNPDKSDILCEFDDFARQVINLSTDNMSSKTVARINRVGVTNAADRGLDMWANFGTAIQIKHLSLTEELAESIVASVTSDRVVIVCKDSEEKIITSLLNQIGWRSRIQSIVTENDLLEWYDKALHGKYSEIVGDKLIQNILNEIMVEFPATNSDEFAAFCKERGYDQIKNDLWR